VSGWFGQHALAHRNPTPQPEACVSPGVDPRAEDWTCESDIIICIYKASIGIDTVRNLRKWLDYGGLLIHIGRCKALNPPLIQP